MLLQIHEIEALLQVKRNIERSISNPITIRSLLRGTGFSESKLTQGFKFLFQYTVHRYHLTISMEYAYSLLADDMPVKEVALKLGYKSQSHFNRSFRQVFGIAPSHIRRDIDAVE
ncbi:AraC-like DNA-binding protein [Pedobacter africanus]|uniref:helix-turn-helix transcriptional regulator n=1 Tax=Pedobacter africanus TaxID=151894 RepID=UPI00339121FE